MKRLLLLLLPVALAFSACDRTEPEITGPVQVTIRPVIDGSTFEVGQEYNNLQGRKFRFDGLQLYVSDIVLLKTDGTEVALKNPDQDEPVWLFDFAKDKVFGAASAESANGGITASGLTAPVGDYEGAKLLIGVRPDLNGTRDPVDYAASHPLSEQHGAFWTWNSGYIFLKIDGQFDDSPDKNGQELMGSLTYHIGLDTLARQVAFEGAGTNFSVSENDNESLAFDLDILRMFYFGTDTLDMMTSHLTHTTNDFPLAETIIDNLANHAITLE